MTLLPDLLRTSSRRFPEKVAMRFSDAQVTFAELDAWSDQIASHLRNLGIGSGDRVAIVYDNTLPAILYFWGVLKAGATTVDIPSHMGGHIIDAVVQEAAPRAMAVQPRKLRELCQGRSATWFPEHIFSDDTLEQMVGRVRSEAPMLKTNPGDVAMIVYTSGTTGHPKGVMLSHDNLISNLIASNALMDLSENDSILVVVPFYYIHGRMQLLLHMMMSGTVVVSAGFQFPETVLRELVETGVTSLSGVPYHFLQLLRRTKLKTTSVPNLRYVLITGGAISDSDLEDLSAALPGVDIHLAYGQTEASPRITYLGPWDVFGEKRRSIGIPLPGVVVEILDGHGNALPTGSIGDVVVGGPGIMKGYVTGDERSSGKIDARGRLWTGDLGYVDDDGYLYLVGRSSDMIKTAGERIFPEEIETVLNAHHAVVESAVVGIPDSALGERVVAYVVLGKECKFGLADLRKHCLRKMPFVRVPRELRLVCDLPKTASGKIDRGKLNKSPTPS